MQLNELHVGPRPFRKGGAKGRRESGQGSDFPPFQNLYSVSLHYPLYWVHGYSFSARTCVMAMFSRRWR